ncbi:ABC transporter permease [Agromyces seonyuensis]|uniref:ABC transporter permease n=1 Tax=Agromyces seonyuensis TaxID=2662446 RepID=A0A6I4NY24_9MICO|nr:ABC transporter permease [Agromyces seonyuensis]MWB99158.1 ABC transporter permease [Agromyces seonyuensis]
MSTATQSRTAPASLGGSGRDGVTDPTFWQSVWLVGLREISTKLRSKSFLISTGITVLFVIGAVMLPQLLSGIGGPTTVAVVGGTSAAAFEGTDVETVEVADRAAGEELVRSGEADALIVPSDDPTGMTVVALDSAPTDLVQLLSVSPGVELLDPDAVPWALGYFIALAFGIVFYMAALTFGVQIASAVVEEKQTRIVEILLSTVSARALLAGKVLGNSILAIGQVALIAVAALTGLVVTDQQVLLAGVGPGIAWFIVFFVVGFVMLAALYAGTAALVSRAEDVGTATAPVTYLVMIPFFLVIFLFDNEVAMGIMSYVPFTANIAMPMRAFLGTAEWWEPILSLVILAATAMLALWIGERLYRNSLLKTGARVKFTEALKG